MSDWAIMAFAVLYVIAGALVMYAATIKDDAATALVLILALVLMFSQVVLCHE